MNKFLVLGYFGNKTAKIDGQTVKTHNVCELLTDYVKSDVDTFDTEDLKFNKLSVLKMLWKLMRCNTLCYLPAHGNLRVIFPIVYVLSVVFRFKIHYFVVGGWLGDFLETLPLHRKMLAKISGIHVETKRLKQQLEESYDFKNVDLFPNFRDFSYNVDKFEQELKGRFGIKECMHIAFVSRVEQSKGLDTLVEISKLLELKGLSDRIVFDFYGPKKDSYFDSFLAMNEMFEYKGVLRPDEVIDTLKMYDALIFPSHYEGEGCPGILVEALSVGLPIIASDWKFNGEFVEERVTGFLCKTFDANAYVEAISLLLNDVDLRYKMSKHAYEKSFFFSIDNAKNLLMDILH